MKKLLVISFLSLVLFLSCDDSLNPVGDLQQKYVLSCIVRGDSTLQTATLTKSYSTGTLNPYDNHADPNIAGAIIRIWNGKDKVTFLYDSVATRKAADKYKTPYRVYLSKNFMPDPISDLEIEAILPNGKKITAKAKVPDAINFSYTANDASIPSKDKKNIKVTWFNSDLKPVFITRAIIYYNKIVNGVKIPNQYSVPESYVQYNNEWIPVYSKPNGGFGVIIPMETMNKAMELISAGDEQKSNYEILGCVVEVVSLDPELSKYYYATARGADIYSVKLDETDYTNISGGSGIFGAYSKSFWTMKFKHDYIYSYGYVPGLSDAQ